MVNQRTDPPLDVTSSLRLGAGADARAVERQLSRLFGESLLGAWPGLEQQLASVPPKVHGRRWGLVLTAALVVVSGTLVIAGTRRPRLDRTTLERRAHYAEELHTFLADGELERASEFIALVRAEGAALDPADPYLDRIIRAEAAIYRYLDADPARLARIRPFLPSSSAAGSPERQLASLTVLSREEQAERSSWLAGLRAPLGRDPELHYLLATVEEARGDLPAAREAWRRSAELGPAWLSHRFEQAEFERRHGDEAVAGRIAGQMLRADPESAWSRLAANEFRALAAPLASAGSRAARVPPPVEVHHHELFGALHAARGDDPGGAQRHLAAALAAVHGEAPFVLDAFDWLIRADLEVLAEELTRQPAWPRDSEVAKRKAARLRPREVAP